uniref:Ubiquitin-like domain-containing protein n=1 Tax=Arion vulgaris TaxID=1028688 RepID=A0A0B6Z420_9EUPU
MERKCNVSNRKPTSRVRSNRRRPGCIRLFVCPTTGGRLEISVSPRETVLGLKAALARKLRVVPTKITLIYKDKVLKDGCIQDHQIPDESHVTLLPHMESGLSLHHSDKSIMHALENLTETQVSDFLSGRSPLMLAIRMGENMVFVQLQLSMLQGQGQRIPQPGQNVNPISPAAAAMLSQKGLSPSAIAEATRCLSQRLHRLHEMNLNSSVRPSGNMPTSAAPRLSQSPTAAYPQNPPATAACQTLFQLPPRQPISNLTLNPSPSPPPSPGAIIDSMKHLGRGVYTGTFQGTLDPSLQDGNGQPRRSVSTILHILNDLLVAAPQCPTQSQGQVATNMQGSSKCHISVPLTPPSSPTVKVSPGHIPVDDTDNTLLRGKMQRIQLLLAERKEQRRTRREMCAPYTNPWSLHKIASANVSSSEFLESSSLAASSVCMAATTTNTKSTHDVADHEESSSDPSNSYCNSNIEQDSLAV